MNECKIPFGIPFPPSQDGAVGIFFALVLSSALLCTVLALDAGRLYWEGQELQRLADMAAVTAIGDITSDQPATIEELDLALERANTNIRQNLPKNWSEIEPVVQQVEIKTEDGIRHLCTSPNCDAYGIQVVAERQTCSSIFVNVAALIGGAASIPEGDGLCYAPITLTRHAIAAGSPQIAAFSAGTTLLNLCTSESTLLQPLMSALSSSDLCVALVGSKGVADTSISLIELRDGMGALLGIDSSVITLDTFLTESISLGNLIDIFLQALSADSESVASLTALREMLSLDILNIPPLQLGEILRLGSCQWSGGGLVSNSCDPQKTLVSALSSEIDAGNMLQSAILLASPTNAIDVSTNLDLGGLVELKNLGITIIEPPRIAIGPIGCSDGEPSTSGCSRWLTEASPGQIGISTGLAVGLPSLLSLDLDINSTLVGAEVGISNMERTGDLVDGIPEYILYAGANLKPIELDISGNLSLPVLGNLLPQLSDLPLLGPVLDTLLNGLLDNLLGGLGLGLGKTETLISVEQEGPVVLSIGPLTARIAADSDEVSIDWPSNPSSTIVAKNLSGISLSANVDSILDSSIPLESETKIQTCVVVCSPATYRTDQLATPLKTLLTSSLNLQEELVTIISGPLLNLLDELLGVKVNSTEVEVLEVATGTRAVLI